MTLLPERPRQSLPQAWERPEWHYPPPSIAPERRGPSVLFVLICAGCVVLGAWLRGPLPRRRSVHRWW